MPRSFIPQALAAATLVAMSGAALAQETTANTVNTFDPALNAPADPLAENTTNTLTTDPLATDPMATTTTTTDPLADPMMNTVEDEDGDDARFPWGLLGLLGLAGLLGMNRRDDRDVRVDTRDTPRT